uniref:Uncharacterized protein n=1 Tax=Panagrolaimus sp. ES5 TaxID=591445 RepID=A0AC34FSZ4_9BILA
MSSQITTIAVVPRSDDILDIIRCHIITIISASGQPEHLINSENIIETLDAINPGFLEDCFEETTFDSINEMIEEACKKLASNNIFMKFSSDQFCYSIPAISHTISDFTIMAHPLIAVYKMIFCITKNINLPVEFRRIVRWYKNLYQKKLTPALFAEELNLDPAVFKKYVQIIKNSGIFYVYQNKPLQIQAHYNIRVAMIKSMSRPH